MLSRFPQAILTHHNSDNCPVCIFIGDITLMGPFFRITLNAYEGHGRFHYGLVEIENNCKIDAVLAEMAGLAEWGRYENFTNFMCGL